MNNRQRRTGAASLLLGAILVAGGCGSDQPTATSTPQAPQTTPADPVTPTSSNGGDAIAFCRVFTSDQTWMDDLEDDPSTLSAAAKMSIKKAVTDLAAVAPGELKTDMDLVADTYVKVMDGQLTMSPGEEQILKTINGLMKIQLWAAKHCAKN